MKKKESFNKHPKLIVDANHPCWDTMGMHYLEFASDIYLSRQYTKMILNKARKSMLKNWLLEQQINELINNAIYHGNKKDKNRLVKIHYKFSSITKVIIEDEGEGFTRLEEWNQFNIERNKALFGNDIEKISKYICFKTEETFGNNGGNSLFAALEYWNKGIIYSQRKNKVCVMRDFIFS